MLAQHCLTAFLWSLCSDTGATVVAVSEQAAQKLGMQKGQGYQVSTANGPAIAYDSQLSSLQLGDIVLNRIYAPALLLAYMATIFC